MLRKISDSIQKSAVLVTEIAAASNEQATAISQIDQGISQVSSVIQTNSATAEESAASSEELSGQAEVLKQMVGQFVLKEIAHAVSPVFETKKPASPARHSAGQKIELKASDSFGKY